MNGYKNLQEFFKIGMSRDIPDLYVPPQGGHRINLGVANKAMPEGVVSVGFPEWDANTMPLPFDDETVSEVWALHFMEHVDDPEKVLRDVERVLVPGGVMNICVPYGVSHMWVQDLSHRRPFNEDSWRHTFANPFYDDKGPWRMKVGLNIIMAIKGENLALLTQLIKE